jgi:branched-chain amino acid transport system permease protein
MDQILLFVVIGLAPGALIAGVALGVVLTYRGAGVINIATGSFALVGAYAYYGLVTEGYLFVTWLSLGGAWPVWAAVLGALIVCALLGVALELGVLRPLRDQSPLTKLLATLGVYLALGGFVMMCFGTNGQAAPSVFGRGGVRSIEVFDVRLRTDGLILGAIVIVLAIVLTVIYRYTAFGTATRAAAENDTNAALLGINANGLSLVNVVAASVLAGGLGVLVAPMTGLNPTTIPAVIVPALAAALLAGFTSFGIAVAAGILMGVASSLLTLGQSQPWFPTVEGYALTGTSELLFFVVVIVAMFLRGSSLPRRESLTEKRLPGVPEPVHLVRPALLALVGATVFFAVAPYDLRQAGINTFIGVVISLSFVLIIGYVGQSSLLQVALAGVAGFATSKVAIGLGIGFPLGPILSIGLAVAVGTLVAFSALRVRGINLVIVTIAAAVAIENFVFKNPVWGGGSTGSKVPSPEVFGWSIGPDADFFGTTGLPSPLFGILVAIVTIVACLFVASVRKIDMGHRFLAVRSNERAAASSGIDVRATKLIAFALSSAIAGLAGVLYGYNFGSVTAGRFSLVTVLSVIAFSYIAGITTVRGAVLAGTMTVGAIGGFLVFDRVGLPSALLQLVGGLALVTQIVFRPAGIMGRPPKSQTGERSALQKLGARRAAKPQADKQASVDVPIGEASR